MKKIAPLTIAFALFVLTACGDMISGIRVIGAPQVPLPISAWDTEFSLSSVSDSIREMFSSMGDTEVYEFIPPQAYDDGCAHFLVRRPIISASFNLGDYFDFDSFADGGVALPDLSVTAPTAEDLVGAFGDQIRDVLPPPLNALPASALVQYLKNNPNSLTTIFPNGIPLPGGMANPVLNQEEFPMTIPQEVSQYIDHITFDGDAEILKITIRNGLPDTGGDGTSGNPNNFVHVKLECDDFFDSALEDVIPPGTSGTLTGAVKSGGYTWDLSGISLKITVTLTSDAAGDDPLTTDGTNGLRGVALGAQYGFGGSVTPEFLDAWSEITTKEISAKKDAIPLDLSGFGMDGAAIVEFESIKTKVVLGPKMESTALTGAIYAEWKDGETNLYTGVPLLGTGEYPAGQNSPSDGEYNRFTAGNLPFAGSLPTPLAEPGSTVHGDEESMKPIIGDMAAGWVSIEEIFNEAPGDLRFCYNVGFSALTITNDDYDSGGALSLSADILIDIPFKFKQGEISLNSILDKMGSDPLSDLIPESMKEPLEYFDSLTVKVDYRNNLIAT
ncbi:MAG: hypothetical protein LBR23_02355, partial [Spirochaetaceae bacterium]|nr:hypothetical protein [Spirochaetaceae bacterium]